MTDQPATKIINVHVHEGEKRRFNPLWLLVAFCLFLLFVALTCNLLSWIVEALR